MQPKIGNYRLSATRRASLHFPQTLITRRKASSTLSFLTCHSRLQQNKPSSFGATGLIDRGPLVAPAPSRYYEAVGEGGCFKLSNYDFCKSSGSLAMFAA